MTGRNSSQLDHNFCQVILYVELGTTRIRAWDVMIFIANLVFLIFLTARLSRAKLKLRTSSSPILMTFYGLVLLNVVVSLSRCIAAMVISGAALSTGVTERVLWLVVRFFLLSTEMGVIIFCLAFGHLDSQSSSRYVMLATFLVSLVFSGTQGSLELAVPSSLPPNVFLHGGLKFWMATSLIFSGGYLLLLLLPMTSLRHRLVLPTKGSFYVYIVVLIGLNLSQGIGSGVLLYGHMLPALCVLDVTSMLYFTLYSPLVYYCFLSELLSVSQPSILFSYKAQVDDLTEEDNVSLPHQQSFSSLKTDSDYIYQGTDPSVYDSTHLDRSSNALYVASLHSPDSLPGSSIVSAASVVSLQLN